MKNNQIKPTIAISVVKMSTQINARFKISFFISLLTSFFVHSGEKISARLSGNNYAVQP